METPDGKGCSQSLQQIHKDLFSIHGDLGRFTSVCILHVAFMIRYVHDNLIKLCRKQAEIILNHVNSNVWVIGQEARRRNCKMLKLGGGQTYARSAH
jgi:hypothetical protein